MSIRTRAEQIKEERLVMSGSTARFLWMTGVLFSGSSNRSSLQMTEHTPLFSSSESSVVSSFAPKPSPLLRCPLFHTVQSAPPILLLLPKNLLPILLSSSTSIRPCSLIRVTLFPSSPERNHPLFILHPSTALSSSFATSKSPLSYCAPLHLVFPPLMSSFRKLLISFLVL